MKIVLILILSIFLSGCPLFKKPEPIFVPPNTVVHIDTANLQQCSELNENMQVSTFEDYLLKEYPQFVKQYADCAIKQSNSIKLIRQLGNIKD